MMDVTCSQSRVLECISWSQEHLCSTKWDIVELQQAVRHLNTEILMPHLAQYPIHSPYMGRRMDCSWLRSGDSHLGSHVKS